MLQAVHKSKKIINLLKKPRSWLEITTPSAESTFQPLRSQTSTNPRVCGTSLALNFTAVDKSTIATGLHFLILRVEAPAAAEDAAALLPLRGVVAGPALSAERTQRGVGQAEEGRLLRVHQVHLAWWLDGLSLRHEALAVVAGYHLGRAVETLLQAVAHLPERRHLSRAGLQGARARQAVALALRAHVALDCLQQ